MGCETCGKELILPYEDPICHECREMEDEQYAELDEIVFRIAELWEEICDAKGELMELDWERLEIEYKLFQKGLL